jgi:hypothetical protein
MKNIDLLGFKRIQKNKIKYLSIIKIKINHKLLIIIKKKIKKFKQLKMKEMIKNIKKCNVSYKISKNRIKN